MSAGAAALQEVGRFDVLRALIDRELETHRQEIEDDDSLRLVEVHVRFNRSTGLPRSVTIRRESEVEMTLRDP